MAKDKEDRKTQDIEGNITTWKVGYTFVDENANLRSGALIIEAATAEIAKDLASYRVEKRALMHARITTAKPY